jgi:ferredoxin
MSQKKIKTVRIAPGCITCSTCAAICPKVFEIKAISTVKPGADFDSNADDIREAAEMCPVEVIKVEEE